MHAYGGYLLSGVLNVLVSQTALACSVAAEWPNPAKTAADVIVEGTVGRIEGRDTWTRSTILSISRLHKGDYKQQQVELRWSTGPGMCGPPGPIPEPGARLTVYLLKREGQLVVEGWRPVN